jgi:hypothetical protein
MLTASASYTLYMQEMQPTPCVNLLKCSSTVSPVQRCALVKRFHNVPTCHERSAKRTRSASLDNATADETDETHL